MSLYGNLSYGTGHRMTGDLVCGDIIITRSNNWISKGIRFFEKLQTGKARVSHVAIALGPDQCIESLWRVKINDLKKYYDKDGDVFVYRIPMTISQRDNLYKELLKSAGGAYGWTKLPLFALDGLSSAFLRLFGRKRPVFFFTPVPLYSQDAYNEACQLTAPDRFYV